MLSNGPLWASVSDDVTTVAHSSASRSQRKLKRMQSWGGEARRISWQRDDLTSYCTERKLNSAMNWRQKHNSDHLIIFGAILFVYMMIKCSLRNKSSKFLWHNT